MSVPSLTPDADCSYRVELDLYSGPLDLLLYLVRRNELEVRDLPMARLTEQFLEHLEVLRLLDLDAAAEFIVMASTLIEIKSRMVLPQERDRTDDEPSAAEADDPRSDLVRQLIEYKRFKDAARLLEEHALVWQERYPRLSDERPGSGSNPAQDRIRQVELWDLVSALSRILRRDGTTPGTAIVYDDTPISTYIERIHARLLEERRVAFTALFEGVVHRSRIISLFLAVLELLRHHGCRAEQPADFGEIWILAPPETGEASG